MKKVLYAEVFAQLGIGAQARAPGRQHLDDLHVIELAGLLPQLVHQELGLAAPGPDEDPAAFLDGGQGLVHAFQLALVVPHVGIRFVS
jgi:hypothetical protein